MQAFKLSFIQGNNFSYCAQQPEHSDLVSLFGNRYVNVDLCLHMLLKLERRKQTSIQRADNLIKSQRFNCCRLLWIEEEEAIEGTTNLITKQSCDK